MSLLPFIFDDDEPLYSQYRPRLSLTPSDWFRSTPLRSLDYYRPWRQMERIGRDVGSTIKADKDKFQLNLDVQHFSPEEISVKTADGYVVVEGKHEEKQDEHGYVSRQFVRRYALPDGCNAETVASRLSSDGVLTVTAPRQTSADKGARSVPIALVGPVRRKLQEDDIIREQNTPKKKRVKK